MNGPAPERLAVGALVASGIGSVTTAIAYVEGANTQLVGLSVAAALGGLAVALVTWGNHLMPEQVVEGPREPMAGSDSDLAGLELDLHDPEVERRTMLRRGLVIALAFLGGAAVFPLRSLGPSPGRSLVRTPWRRGLRLITNDGRPIRAVDVPDDGLVTVFPEGFPGSPDGQAVLVRVPSSLVRPRPGRADWAPDGLLAYSKLCTHAGCPVGLYQPGQHQLLCPCHQSSFDVLDGARPVDGPAAVSLPQLPLRIDDDGFLVAEGDFSDPVGPGFWERG